MIIGFAIVKEGSHDTKYPTVFRRPMGFINSIFEDFIMNIVVRSIKVKCHSFNMLDFVWTSV